MGLVNVLDRRVIGFSAAAATTCTTEFTHHTHEVVQGAWAETSQVKVVGER